MINLKFDHFLFLYQRLNENLILENLMNKESVTDDNTIPTMDLSCKDTNAEEESKNNGNQNVNVDDVDGKMTTDKDLETYKIAVSVHDEQVQDTNSSSKSTANILHILSTKEKVNGRENDDTANSTTVTKTTFGDTQCSSLGTSIFYTEKTVLGASTSSLTSISSSTNPYRPAGPAKHRRITGYIDENDLSTPYNYYRCLSPNEHYGKS